MFVTNQTKINKYGLNNATIKQGIISTSSDNISTGDFIYKVKDTENKYSNVVVLDGYSDPIYLSSPSTDVYTVACFKDKTLAIMDIGLTEKIIRSTHTFENSISDIILYATLGDYHQILVTTVGTSSTQYKHELTLFLVANTGELARMTSYGAFGNYANSNISSTDKFVKFGSFVYNILFVSYAGPNGYTTELEVYQIGVNTSNVITVIARNMLQLPGGGGGTRYEGDITKVKAVKSTAYALHIQYSSGTSKAFTIYRNGNNLVLSFKDWKSGWSDGIFGTIDLVAITNAYNNVYYVSYYYYYNQQPRKQILKITLNTDNTITSVTKVITKAGPTNADYSSLDTDTIGAILEYDSKNRVYYVNNFYTHKIDIYNTSLVKQTTYDNFTTGNKPTIFKPTNERIVSISDFNTSTTVWKKYNCIVKQVNNYHYEEDDLNVGQTLNNYTPPFEVSSNYIFTDTNGYYFVNRRVITSDNLSSVEVGDYCVTASSSTTLYQVYSVGSYYVNLLVIKSATKTLINTTTTYTKGNTYYSDIDYVAGEQPEAGTIIDGSVSGNYVVIKASDDTLYYYEKVTITSTGDNNTYYQILTFSNSNLTNAFSTTVSRIAKVTPLKRLEAMGIAINNGQPSDTIDYYTFNNTIST